MWSIGPAGTRPRSAVALTALLVGCLAATVVARHTRSTCRDVVCRRRGRRFRVVLGRRRCGHAWGKQARPPTIAGAAPGTRQSAPARRANRADRVVAGDRAYRAGGGGARRGQSRASDRRANARRSARLLFHRHSAGAARRFPGNRARRSGRAYAASADDAGSDYQAERGTGRAGAGSARGALGVAQRPGPDLFRRAAQRFGTRRRRMVATRLSGPAADFV